MMLRSALYRHRWFFLIATLLLICAGAYFIPTRGCPSGFYSCAAPFLNTGSSNLPIASIQILLSPPLWIGVFVGAPLLSRDPLSDAMVRNRTNQWRSWLFAELGLLALAVCLFAALLSALTYWWLLPVITSGPYSIWSYYNFTGTVLVATSLFAFFLGALIGTLARRTLLSMLLTFCLMLFVIPILSIIPPDQVSHYWSLQIIETAILLVLSLICSLLIYLLWQRRLARHHGIATEVDTTFSA